MWLVERKARNSIATTFVQVSTNGYFMLFIAFDCEALKKTQSMISTQLASTHTHTHTSKDMK